MSFEIRASGSRHFRYAKSNNPDEDIFTAADIIAAISSVSVPNLKGVAEGAADYVLPGVDGVTRDAINSLAKHAFLHTLVTSVCRLASFKFASQGSIGVAADRSGLLGGSKEFARYAFSPGIQPGIEFMKSIGPALAATGLNHYGTLRALAHCLNTFYDFLDDEKDRPVLLIELFN